MTTITKSIVTHITNIITIIHNITQPINTPHTLSLLISKLNRLETQITQLQDELKNTKEVQFRLVKKHIEFKKQSNIKFNNLIPNPKLDEIYQEQFPNNQ